MARADVAAREAPGHAGPAGPWTEQAKPLRSGGAYFADSPARALAGAALRPPNAGRGKSEDLVVRLRVSSHSTGIERQTKEHIDLHCF